MSDAPFVLPEINTAFEAISDTAYFLGPGDFLMIGYGSKQIQAPVNPEGFVILEGVSPIRVNMMRLDKAKATILAGLSKTYKSDKAYVTLAKAKKFIVSITGAVILPGIYPVNPGSRIHELILASGGFTAQSSRRITLVRSTGDSLKFETQDYFLNNDLSQNPYLNQGDRVIVPNADLTGNFLYIREERNNRPIDLRSGDNLLSVLSRYDNFKNGREWDSVVVFKNGRFIEVVHRKDAGSYAPKSGTVLEVCAPKPTIFVSGAVAKPGIFDYNVNFTALDYISMAGVMTTTGQHVEVDVVSVEGVTRRIDSSRDMLRPGDHVLVPLSKDARFRDYLNVITSIASLAVAVATFVALSAK